MTKEIRYGLPGGIYTGTQTLRKWVRDFRLTLAFAATAMVVIAAATIIVYQVIGNLAGDSLALAVEERASRDAINVESKINGKFSMVGLDPAMTVGKLFATTRPQHDENLTLEMLAGPQGLDAAYPWISNGLNVLQMRLLDLNGGVVWASDGQRPGAMMYNIRLFDSALVNGVSSRYVAGRDNVDPVGDRRPQDFVETYVPLRQLPSGKILGVIELRFRPSRALAIEVAKTKGTVLSTTVATMFGLFAFLLAFILAANVKVKNQQTQLERFNDSLAQQVEDRTAELESFSYSVSHDLRAPLNSINGFSQALYDDYSGVLDEDGKDYLQRVLASTRKMNQLIDGLLKLSTMSRIEMDADAVDLSGMASEIAEGLKMGQPGRDVEFVVEDQLLATGDAQMLNAALENLLSNAWKYTGKRAKAMIEFGALSGNGTTTYFVRDDGAGFDMAYADKLFGAFQRLHTESEFEGTGIGLATVRRVVQRHGGKVWAESEVDRGATFYFTLAPSGNASNIT